MSASNTSGAPSYGYAHYKEPWKYDIPRTSYNLFYTTVDIPQQPAEGSSAVNLSIYRIVNPPGGHYMEHHVATYGTTMALLSSKNSDLACTPEKKTDNNGKIPDLTLENVIRVTQNGQNYSMLRLKTGFEFKKVHGDIIVDAMAQLSEAISESVDWLGEQINYGIFAVVICGKKIFFGEYHTTASNLYEDGIENVEGFISLGQPYYLNQTRYIKGVVAPVPGMELLIPAPNRLIKTTLMREAAKKYTVPCVYDITNPAHQRTIAFLYNHVCGGNQPRPVP